MLISGTFLMGRYEIVERIGVGGMAEVYKAKDTSLNRFVAVKVLRQEFCSNETFVKKFRVEAQSAAGLSHPNIVSVYDVGEENDIYFIIMELVEGITLKNYIDMKGKLEIKEALNISVQIAQGLSAAHNKRIIHRDIKPQNIIISRDGKVKVTDFGIARMADSTTVTTTAAGTVSYISPEQARGNYSDEKSDIYSLGITMYEMLTGKVPYEGETNVAIALMHIQGKMTPPRELEPSIPVSFEKIVLKCTQKKPEWRYLTARDLIADLRKVLTNPDGEYVIIQGLPDAVSDLSANGAGALAGTESQNATSSADNRGNSNVNTGSASEPSDISSSEPEDKVPDDKVVIPELSSDRKKENKKADKYEKEDIPLSKEDAQSLLDDEEEEVDSHVGKVLMTMGIAGFVILLVVLGVLAMYITGLIGGGASIFGGKDKDETSLETGTVQTTETSTQVQTTEVQTTEVQTTETETETETEAPIKVPNLLGKTLDEAETLLNKKDLEIDVKEGTSNYYDVGEVYQQSIEAGTVVDEHTVVTVYICKGTEAFTLENVAGINYERASATLKAEGLKIQIKFVEDYSMGTDEVAYTDPVAGSSVVEGDTVTLYVCSGQSSKTVTVPDVRGKDLDTAVEEINDAGLTYNGKSSDYSDTYPEGQVMDQSLTPGKSVDKNATMSVTVSLGSKVQKETTYTATFSVSNPFESEVAAQVEEGTLKVVVEQDGTSSTVFNDTVTRDSFSTDVADISVDSSSNSEGTVTAYFNDVEYSTWTVNYE